MILLYLYWCYYLVLIRSSLWLSLWLIWGCHTLTGLFSLEVTEIFLFFACFLSTRNPSQCFRSYEVFNQKVSVLYCTVFSAAARRRREEVIGNLDLLLQPLKNGFISAGKQIFLSCHFTFLESDLYTRASGTPSSIKDLTKKSSCNITATPVIPRGPPEKWPDFQVAPQIFFFELDIVEKKEKRVTKGSSLKYYIFAPAS